MTSSNRIASRPAPPARSTDVTKTRALPARAWGQIQTRGRRLQQFVAEFAADLGLKNVPRLVLDFKLPISGYYDAPSNSIHLPPSALHFPGERLRKILAHELIHAWQHQSGLLDFNLPDKGVYVPPPTASLREALSSPVVLAHAILYALQPVELHAELARLIRMGLGALPAKPWA